MRQSADNPMPTKSDIARRLVFASIELISLVTERAPPGSCVFIIIIQYHYHPNSAAPWYALWCHGKRSNHLCARLSASCRHKSVPMFFPARRVLRADPLVALRQE